MDTTSLPHPASRRTSPTTVTSAEAPGLTPRSAHSYTNLRSSTRPRSVNGPPARRTSDALRFTQSRSFRGIPASSNVDMQANTECITASSSDLPARSVARRTG